jgi:hypothetical protein
LIRLPKQEHDHELTADVRQLEKNQVHNVPVMMVSIFVHVVRKIQVTRDENQSVHQLSLPTDAMAMLVLHNHRDQEERANQVQDITDFPERVPGASQGAYRHCRSS